MNSFGRSFASSCSLLADMWLTEDKAFEIGYYSNKFIENFRCARLNDVCASERKTPTPGSLLDVPYAYRKMGELE
jgi:hypothetical protein